MLGQALVAASAALLAMLDFFSLVTPLVLLGLTFALSSGATWRQPAYQASVGELVPRSEIAAAVALNSINFNLARSLGPALGGFIIVGYGAFGTFAFNAVANLFVIAVLLFWRRAIALTTCRASACFRPWAPACAMSEARPASSSPCSAQACSACRARPSGRSCRSRPKACPTADLTYGLLLGALGMGAVLGAITIGELRRRLQNEGVILLGHVLFASASLALAVTSQLWLLLVFLLLGGLAWMIILSTFNVTVQLTAAEWVKGRALSVYFTGLFGGMSLGSWLWGEMAEQVSLEWALASAGIATLIVGLIGLLLRLPTNLARDLTTPLAIDDGSLTPARPRCRKRVHRRHRELPRRSDQGGRLHDRDATIASPAAARRRPALDALSGHR